MVYEIKNNRVVLRHREDGNVVCSLGYRLIMDSIALEPDRLVATERGILATFSHHETLAATIEDSFETLNGCTAVTRQTILFASADYRIAHTFSVPISQEPALFVPAVLYKGNLAGKGAFPRKTPLENEWAFIESRTPLPAATILTAGDRGFAMCCDPSRSPRFPISVSTKTSSAGAETTVWEPGYEFPKRYTGKKTLDPTTSSDRNTCYHLAEGMEPLRLTITFHLMEGPLGDNGPFGFYREFVDAYRRSAPSDSRKRTQVSWQQYRELKYLHLLSLVEPVEPGKTACLVMGRGNGNLQDVYEYTAGSFLVKSLEAAVILARAEDSPSTQAGKKMLQAVRGRVGVPACSPTDLAIMIGNFFLQGERAPGVHQDCYDRKRRIWGGYLGISEHDDFRNLINARCNGEVMASYISLYEILKNAGRTRSEFIELPKRVARFYIKHQFTGRQDGSFGRWWSPEGRAVNSLGTNGAYIVSFLCAIEPYMVPGDGVAQALQRATRYYGQLVDSGEYFGDTLDADSCDKEAGVTLMNMFLDLYERDGNTRWLDYARKAAEFIATWIWQYDREFPESAPLAGKDFSTTGMTSVSVAHHHLDFYGMLIAYGYLRLWEHSGEPFFKDQGRLMLDACRQLIATEDDLLGRGPDDIGWQPEQINHTDWDYFDRTSHKHGSYDIDIAWVTVLGLGAYQKIEKRYPDIFSD